MYAYAVYAVYVVHADCAIDPLPLPSQVRDPRGSMGWYRVADLELETPRPPPVQEVQCNDVDVDVTFDPGFSARAHEPRCRRAHVVHAALLDVSR